jgi:hypothetical protein
MRGMSPDIELREPKRDSELVHERLIVSLVDDRPIESQLPMLQ